MFSPYYPARFDQAGASDLVPNRKVTRTMSLSSSSSSSSSYQPAKRSKTVTVDEEAEAEVEATVDDESEAQAEVTPNLIALQVVGRTNCEMDSRITLVASALNGDDNNSEINKEN
jgi:hypothetical protein